MKKILYPNEYLKNVKKIELELLNKNNIRGIILDVDNTLIDFNKKMPEGIKQWIENLKEKGIKFCILSNSNELAKVKYVSEKLDIPFIYFAKKPFKSGFKKAKEKLKLSEKNIAVVGDQVMTDVVGANRSGMFSILVEPIDNKEYFITKIKRPLEKFIINRYLKNKTKSICDNRKDINKDVY